MWGFAPLRHEVCLRCRVRQTLQTLRKHRLSRSLIAQSADSRRFVLSTSSATVLYRIDKYDTKKRRLARSDVDCISRRFQRSYGSDERVATLDSARRYRSQVTAANKRLRIKKSPIPYKKRALPNSRKIELEVATLGQPSSIIHVDNNQPNHESSSWREQRRKERKDVEEAKESGSGEYEKEASKGSAAASNYTAESIFEAMERGSLKPELREIYEGIEGIKDHWLAQLDPNEIPSQSDCHQLSIALSEGFTSEQLERYLNSTIADEADEYDDLQGIFFNDNCNRSMWYAGQSQIKKTLRSRLYSSTADGNSWRLTAPHVIGKVKDAQAKRVSKKNSIIEGIFRRSWKLRSAEEVEELGELDVSIQPEHQLLLETRYDIFQKLESRFHVSIQPSEDKSIFRIKGKHADCGQTFTAIFALVNSVQVRRLELKNGIMPTQNLSTATGAARLWQDDLLEEIGAFTKAFIKRVKLEDKLVGFDVTFLAPQRTDGTGVETVVFNGVRRIIDMITSDRSSRNEVRMVAHLNDLQCEQVPIPSDAALPMHHRNPHWYRFRNADNSGHTGQLIKGSIHFFKLAIRAATYVLTTWRPRQSDLVEEEIPNQPWSNRSQISISVKTGYLAFNDPEKVEPLQQQVVKHGDTLRFLQKQDKITTFKEFLNDRPRLFVSSLPGGLRSFEKLNEAHVQEEERIILRLKPSGFSVEKSLFPAEEPSLSVLPDLVLELMPLSQEAEPMKLAEASLAMAHPTKEMIMPFDECDLQMSSKSITEGIRDNFDPAIVKFVDSISATDGRIDEQSIPAGIQLEIPGTSLREYDIDMSKHLAFSQYRRDVERTHMHAPKTEPTPNRALTRPNFSNILESNEMKQPNIHVNGMEADVGWYDDTIDDNTTADSQDRFDDFVRAETPSIQLRSSSSHFRTSVTAYYQFASLEYHSRLRGNFKGYPLIYTIVDAGGIGGRYEELVLEALPSDEKHDNWAASKQVDEKEYVQSLVAGVLEASNKVDERNHRGRKIPYKKSILEQWYKGRLDKTPGIKWFVPWFETSLDMVRRINRN